ncbi:MAG: glycosyltransferase family 2 protein [Acidimicrobiia bacterium]
MLSIVIPAYNEERTIGHVLDVLAEADLLGLEREIIVVDDGSSDATFEVATSYLRAIPNLKVARCHRNGGKGTALRVGFGLTSGDYVVVQDADLEYDPADLHLLIRPLLDNRADVVVGSRFSGGRPRRVVYHMNTLGNRAMTALSNVLSGLSLTDIHSCYMMFDGAFIRSIAPTLQSDRWGFNPEIVAHMADERRHLRIVEVGISYYGRSKEEGKKIAFRHGLIAVAEIIKFNLPFRRSSRRRPLAAYTLVDAKTLDVDAAIAAELGNRATTSPGPGAAR